MTYRFIHVGDLHLIAGPRNQDRLDAIDWVIADATKARVDAWFWPGDLTHVGMTIEIRNALVARVIDMAKFAPVIIVPGNHDPDHDLDFLGKLDTRHGVTVVTEPRVIEFNPQSNREYLPVALFCLPYPSKARLVAAGTPHDQINQAASDALDLLFMEAGATLDAARKAGQLTGAIGHINITGAVASCGQPQIGQELEINETHLARLGGCFKIFNHIHKHQVVGSAVYAGSLCRLDWGETEPKGYVVVEAKTTTSIVAVAEGNQAKRWLHTETFIPVPVAPMYHAEGVLTRDRFEWTVTKGPDGPKDDPPMGACPACAGSGVQIAAALGTAALGQMMLAAQDEEVCLDCGGAGTGVNWSGCDVRVRARYSASEREVLATARARVLKEFAGARRFEFEPIAVQTRELRAPEVMAAVTLDEKLKAWAKLAGVTWSGEIERCAAELQATEDGDAVVDAVDERLSALR